MDVRMPFARAAWPLLVLELPAPFGIAVSVGEADGLSGKEEGGREKHYCP